MYRKFLLIIAAIVGVTFAPAGALAARGGFGGGRGFVGGGGRGFVGGSFRGAGFRGGAWRGGRGFGRGFGWGYPALGVGLGLGLVGAGYYGGYYGGYPYGYGGCWQRVVSYGPYGPIVRRIWVCD